MARPSRQQKSEKRQRDIEARRERIQQQEREKQRSTNADIVLRAVQHKSPAEALDSIDKRTLKITKITKIPKSTPLYWMCRVYEALLANCNRYKTKADLEVVKQILLHCYKYSDLFEGQKNLELADGLISIAYHSEQWIRPLKDWRPNSHNTWRQFDSLLRYLFAKYYVPTFMNTAWYGHHVRQQQWFIHVGQGQNIRTAEGLPINLTKKMAHHFLQAPSDFNISEAFRYAQVVNMGGDERLVRALLGTRLGSIVDVEDEFWLSVVRWFVANPILDTIHHGPILDYIYNQKYVRQIPNPDITGPCLLVPQPNLSMKGRSPETLLKQVEEWHRHLGREERSRNNARWMPSGIPPWEFTEGEKENRKLYTIDELLSSKELIEEGKAMKHCASSYSDSCAKGDISIWSMKCYTNTEVNRLVTIEVKNPIKTIVQVRKKLNVRAQSKEMDMLRRWCAASGLKMSQWI